MSQKTWNLKYENQIFFLEINKENLMRCHFLSVDVVKLFVCFFSLPTTNVFICKLMSFLIYIFKKLD